MEYLQTTGLVFGHTGQGMGTLEQGEDGEDVATILYVNLTFMMHPLVNV
jgi:hypothetical protein